MNVEHCEGCDRDFLPSTCPYHCGPVCCRKMACKNMRPNRASQRESMQAQKRCIVCGAHGAWFQKFAPCVPNVCKRYRYWDLQHGKQYICWEHHPRQKERYHVKYCSLQCYNSWEYGHRERMLRRGRIQWRRTGQFRANYRKELKEHGGKLY